MADQDILSGKKILAVDDEEDILAVIEEQLETCNLITARDYHRAKELLEKDVYDLAVLDIMGVRGFELLEIATQRKIPSVILTAHSMTPESFQRAIDKGAVSFLPKDELARLSELIAEILGEVKEGRTHWEKLKVRLGHRFKELWGTMWEEIKFPRDPNISW
ncbi:response regulator [Desulfomonile tiedjei]|uniref:Response regulator with CheY-like receiver, AAA-type ATPase, and DNA-binding domains n=1 Tax=Desulfomonile tiedjei (strain ATCC 49306 / DSM 6799 / DCB-1) TaxID=706587 RepID=I4C4R4_DESTA|nr:response regulator [Desulfomonile tiedjei]AFM24555.1 response regulator with CheY-like receiver, AAA-type ATPase, and DNA-binding domains [Desulfomonile tiedjei DSM 6799]